ncbi:MAG: TIGR03118 family protein [Bryobacteraceae bacterium]
MHNSRAVFLKPLTIGFIVLTFSSVVLAQRYTQTNLVSDMPGSAKFPDSNLQNAWGLVAGPATPWWVSNNHTGTSTLYDGAGTALTLVVAIPDAAGTGPGSPTGVVFNGSSTDFLVNGQPARFIFVSEDGTISAFVGTTTALKVNKPSKDAVYKGATIAEVYGKKYLLVTNFHSGHVEVYDTYFKRVPIPEERFDDDRLPAGFAPFNIQGIGPNIYVTYAKQDADKHDDVHGAGLGYVDVYSPDGKFLQRLEHGPWFNGPWGIVLTPANFGEFSHALLVGNFGAGTITAFNPVTGRFLGHMRTPAGSVLKIDGLWALNFGNGDKSGPANTLFFTAGPNNEMDGLFGTLTPIASELNEADEQ